jgi:hypothetical protein
MSTNKVLSVFEQACMYRTRLLLVSAEVIQYTSWPKEFAVSQIQGVATKTPTLKLDPRKLTLKQAKELGFGRWDNKSKIMLIPLWLVPALNPNTVVTCINGKRMKLKDADNDHRFGCIAYGVASFAKERK